MQKRGSVYQTKMSVATTERPYPEETAIDAIRDGDRHAFAELVRRENRFVRGVILGVLGDPDRADDVAQQVWATFWGRIGELRDTQRWRPWLYRLARNAAVDALPVLYREPFVLRHLNGWSYKQIAEVMDMPVDSIETRLVRARRLLREALRTELAASDQQEERFANEQ